MRNRKVKLVKNPRNKSKQVGYGQWIPANAVRFNRDGSLSVARKRRNASIAVGEKEEETGAFHPIRWSWDYDPKLAGEKRPKGWFKGQKGYGGYWKKGGIRKPPKRRAAPARKKRRR